MVDKVRRKLSQAVKIDAAGARNITHGEIDRRKLHVLRKSLVPGRASVSSGDQLFEDGPPCGFKALQRSGDIVRAGGQRLIKRNRILHREPGPGANREMCGMQRVPDKHAIASRPLFVLDDWELPPD